MKEIELTKGYKAIIDDDDFERVSKFNWYVCVARKTCVYATAWDSASRKVIYLHRFILDVPKGLQIDHKNRNGLDNRKENLRLATHADNVRNRDNWRKGSYKGVTPRPSKINPFQARITFNKTSENIGSFPTAEDAARAYDQKAREYFGDFAYLNFPETAS